MRPATIIFPNLVLLVGPFLASWLELENLLYIVLLTPVFGLVINALLLVRTFHCQERGLGIAATILALLWGGLGVLLLLNPPILHF